jgi:hypothetical protein
MSPLSDLSRLRRLPGSMVVWFLVAALMASAATARAADEPVQFNRDIRPIMSDTCFLCHGPDKNSRQASLRLDLREQALQPADSGAFPIVPGQPDESEIIRRIFAADVGERMPPLDSHKKLTAKQKELFRRWVAEGAEYQPHWLYVPLVRPDVPRVKDPSLAGHPIDAFILQRLDRRSIAPSPEADRRTLLRRLSLDLIGLPPTPEEIAAFLADDRDDAYEKQVDRLLASEHFGERMAVWWLDVARFTDTVGFHGDQNQRIFPYRDYVINAFNTNKPFDQFTIEQLAGDLLPDPTNEQLVATGFNRLNMMTREGGAQPKEYLAKYGAERVRTVGTTWLGSTLGCCECHDHKFDPFSAEDFYSMSAFFADVKQWGVYSSYGYTPNPELKNWNNEYPFPPEIQVDNAAMQRRLARFQDEQEQLLHEAAESLRRDQEKVAAFEAWLAELREFIAAQADGWELPEATAEVLNGGKPAKKTTAEITGDHVVRLAAKPAKGDELKLTLRPSSRRVASVRLELVPDPQGEGAVVTQLPRQIVRLKAAVQPAKGKARNLGFYYADADLKEPRYASTVELVGVTDGWLTSEDHAQDIHTSVWLLNPPVTLAEGESLTLTVTADSSLVPVRVAVSPLVMDVETMTNDTASRSVRDAADTGPNDEQPPALRHSSFANSSFTAAAYLVSTAADRSVFDRYVALHGQIQECRDGKAWTMITRSMDPLTIRVLPRGNWQDESGPIVNPAVPHFLPGYEAVSLQSPSEGEESQPAGESQRLTRLDLAHWLCSAENPVTARNIVNRLWKPFFGNALSNVVDDLGAQGEPPSHPELLDWLAVEFRESGWDVKHMVKLIVMSRTYRQSSTARPELAALDPSNRWLAFQNPRRLDAEFVRDNALAVSGLLNNEIGGPSAKPYQPDGYYANLQFPDRRYVPEADERQWRRGLYMHWQRAFLHPMLANFDAPAREECTANRTVSNTPQQALTLLNDPSFVEAARALAARLLSQSDLNDTQRLDVAYELALARSPEEQERESLLRFLAAQRKHYTANPADADKVTHIGIAPQADLDRVEWAAWTSVARVILNLHETITRF